MMVRMGMKKPTKATGKAPPAKAPQKPVVASKVRAAGDELLDEEMLVDASGTFRAVSSIAQAQVGHAEDDGNRFASDSLVMQAQRDGFRETGTSPADVAQTTNEDDEAAVALKRQRLVTLAARSEARARRR
jgi:hypothetical protein